MTPEFEKAAEIEANTPIGGGATTLDYLLHAHPWLGELLHQMREERDAARAEVERFKREIQAAGTLEFDWSVLVRLDRLEAAERREAALGGKEGCWVG